MSEAPDWMTHQALPTLNQGKNVLAVEGDDDKDVYKAWLQKLLTRGTILSDTIVIVDAGSKDAVLEGLVWYAGEHRQTWGNLYGLVDRDEWDSSSIAARALETHDCWLTQVAIAWRATSSNHPSLKQP